MPDQPKPTSALSSATDRLERAIQAQQQYVQALNQGLATFSSEMMRVLEYERASALTGIASSLRTEEASLKRRLGLYHQLGYPEQAIKAAEDRLLSIYGQQSAVLAQARGAYGQAGRTDIAGRIYGQEEESTLRAAAFLQRAGQQRTQSALRALSERAQGLEAFLEYAKRAGTPPTEMASARASLAELLQQKAHLERQTGDLAAYYHTQQQLLRHRASLLTTTTAFAQPTPSRTATLPSLADEQLSRRAGLHALLQGIIGGYGLQGPLYPPLALARAREQPPQEVRLRDKMTIVVELRPPGKSEEVLLEQWAQLLATRLAHWLRTVA